MAAGDVRATGCGVSPRLDFGLEPEGKELFGECSPAETGRAGLYLQCLGTGSVYFDDVDLEMIAPPRRPGSRCPPTAGPLRSALGSFQGR